MNIQSNMKVPAIFIYSRANLGSAIQLFIQHRIGTLPVVDDEGVLVGILLLENVIALLMPDFVHLVDNLLFVHDFGAFENRIYASLDKDLPVSSLMQEPVYCEDTYSLLHAAALLHQSEMADLPVVDAGHHLVGIISHVDIGIALLRNWQSTHPIP